MREKINELIESYKKDIEYFKSIDYPNCDFHDVNLGIIIACEQTIRNLEGLLMYLNSTDEAEDTPDIP